MNSTEHASATPPPDVPENIDTVRSAERRGPETDAAPADDPANHPAESRWMSEGGALSDGPAQAEGGNTPEDD